MRNCIWDVVVLVVMMNVWRPWVWQTSISNSMTPHANSCISNHSITRKRQEPQNPQTYILENEINGSSWEKTWGKKVLTSWNFLELNFSFLAKTWYPTCRKTRETRKIKCFYIKAYVCLYILCVYPRRHQKDGIVFFSNTSLCNFWSLSRVSILYFSPSPWRNYILFLHYFCWGCFSYLFVYYKQLWDY